LVGGALSALMPKEAITRYLGRDAPRWISYPASVVGGFALTVCSCTIMPLFASIYKKGAGLGPAMTFLFVGPSVNLLALTFTGAQIGGDIALARIVFSSVFGVVIGLLMAWLFRRDDARAKSPSHTNAACGCSRAFAQQAQISGRIGVFLALLLAVLTAGTLQVKLLTNSYATFTLPGTWANGLQGRLDTILPANPWLGSDGISVHGAFLIVLLTLTGITAWQGLNTVDEGLNTCTYVTLGLVALMLVAASLSVVVEAGGLAVGITGRSIVLVILIAAVLVVAKGGIQAYEAQEWLWETWHFSKRIIPLLLIGVFVSGMARAIIPATWIEDLAGQNTVLANVVGVLFGVVMYFPTLVEVPVAQTFLWLGMHRGPLLAYLLADPGLSVQSMLITSSVIGRKKVAVYVILVAISSVLTGFVSFPANCAC
jgi:uncharacterized membrane protein YraQ (UPF0718 family)